MFVIKERDHCTNILFPPFSTMHNTHSRTWHTSQAQKIQKRLWACGVSSCFKTRNCTKLSETWIFYYKTNICSRLDTGYAYLCFLIDFISRKVCSVKYNIFVGLGTCETMRMKVITFHHVFTSGPWEHRCAMHFLEAAIALKYRRLYLRPRLLHAVTRIIGLMKASLVLMKGLIMPKKYGVVRISGFRECGMYVYNLFLFKLRLHETFMSVFIDFEIIMLMLCISLYRKILRFPRKIALHVIESKEYLV